MDSAKRRVTVRFWPTLLKKSAMVSAAEKYASEIEIFTYGRGFRTQISRSNVKKRRFHHRPISAAGERQKTTQAV